MWIERVLLDGCMERTVCMWSETNVCGKRRLYVKRGVCTRNEACICEKRRMNVQRDVCMWKETYLCEMRRIYSKSDVYSDVYMRKESYWYTLLQVDHTGVIWKDTLTMLRNTHYIKETYIYEKSLIKETYKTDLTLMCSHTTDRLNVYWLRSMFNTRYKTDLQIWKKTYKRDL